MKHKNVDCQEEDQHNGNHAVENQYHGDLIQDHTEESAGKGYQDRSQQQPALGFQLFSIDNGMDEAQQQEVLFPIA